MSKSNQTKDDYHTSIACPNLARPEGGLARRSRAIGTSPAFARGNLGRTATRTTDPEVAGLWAFLAQAVLGGARRLVRKCEWLLWAPRDRLGFFFPLPPAYLDLW